MPFNDVEVVARDGNRTTDTRIFALSACTQRIPMRCTGS